MKRLWLLILSLTMACAPAATPPPAQIDPPFPLPGPLGTAPRVYPLEQGWYAGQPVQYYNFGTSTRLKPDDPTRLMVAPVWLFATGLNADGSPIKLDGQDNLFDVEPGDADYTDLWQAHFVTPSEGYVPNSITTASELQASGMPIEKQPVFVNCPFVTPGSSLADNAKPLAKGWIRGKPVVYFDFGPTSAQPGKVYVFVTGFDAEGNPQLVPGQHFVFDATRASPTYSDFWMVQWVKVDPGYKADSIRSAADIAAANVTPSQVVVNYPHK